MVIYHSRSKINTEIMQKESQSMIRSEMSVMEDERSVPVLCN